jgi:hypothetical protein
MGSPQPGRAGPGRLASAHALPTQSRRAGDQALKLLSPIAYAVDYELHPQGEDIGWSRACQLAGVKLGWDNRHVSSHIMSPVVLGLNGRSGACRGEQRVNDGLARCGAAPIAVGDIRAYSEHTRTE